MPPIRSGFTDFTQALYGTTNNVINILDQQMKEKARSDLLNMQANLDIESNRFMLELQNSNNYENWNQKFDEFIKKQGDIMQKNSHNQYTATAAKEMLQGYSVNMRKKVETQVFNMGQQDILRKNNDTANLIMQNDGLSGQEKMERLSKLIDPEVLTGKIDGNQYDAKIASYATDIYKKHYNNNGVDLIHYAIQNGLSFEWVENQINADDFSIGLKAVDYSRNSIDDYNEGNAQFTDVSHKIDRSSIKSNVLSGLKQVYNATVKTQQQFNHNKLSELNTQIEAISSPLQRMTNYEAALDMLNNDYKGLVISPEVRDNYTNKWNKKIEEIGDTGPSGTGSGSGANSSFDSFAKDRFTGYVLESNKGNFASMNEAFGTYMLDMERDFMSNSYKENKGMTQAQKKDYWNKTLKNKLMGDILLDDNLLKMVHSNCSGAYDEYLALATKLKNPKTAELYADGTSDYIKGLLIDLFMASNGTTDKKEIEQKIKNQIALCEVGRLEKALKGNAEAQLTALENNDIVYTNQYGNVQWLPGGEAKAKDAAETIRKEVQNKTGLKLNFSQWEQTPDDVNPIPIYTDENGRKYKAVTTRNEKGKTTGMQLIDLQTDKAIEGNSMKQKDKEAKRASNKAVIGAAEARTAYDERYARQAQQMSDNDLKELSKKAIANGIDYATEDYLRGSTTETIAAILEALDKKK